MFESPESCQLAAKEGGKKALGHTGALNQATAGHSLSDWWLPFGKLISLKFVHQPKHFLGHPKIWPVKKLKLRSIKLQIFE